MRQADPDAPAVGVAPTGPCHGDLQSPGERETPARGRKDVCRATILCSFGGPTLPAPQFSLPEDAPAPTNLPELVIIVRCEGYVCGNAFVAGGRFCCTFYSFHACIFGH